jgi:hypothetical protein
MTAANIRRHSTRFLFLQNPDDLLIAEPAAFHSSVPLRNRPYRKMATIQGGTSNRTLRHLPCRTFFSQPQAGLEISKQLRAFCEKP